MIVLTGDTHRDTDRIFDFCEEYSTTPEDILIIPGDAGINYFLDESDQVLKRELSQLPVTLLCVHGNHEEHPEEIGTYGERPWRDGIVYAEPGFPTLLFAKDGEIYDLDGQKTPREKERSKKTGAHTVHFPSEIPKYADIEEKYRAEEKNWKNTGRTAKMRHSDCFQSGFSTCGLAASLQTTERGIGLNACRFNGVLLT